MNIDNLPNYRALEAKKLLKNIKTLDMGGADGQLISSVIDPNKVTVIDLDKKALDKNPCKTKIYGDLINNFLEKGSFSQITLFEVIEHVKTKQERLKIFSEARRVLKKGGRLIISTPNYLRLSTRIRNIAGMKRVYPYPVAGGKGIPYTDWHYFEYSEEFLKQDLIQSGFTKIETYCKFLQLPYLNTFFDIKFSAGLVLYAIATK